MGARTLLLRNATLVATMDDARREIADGGVLIRGHVIEAVGPAAALPSGADEIVDAAARCCCRASSIPIIISSRR